ncbi:hypothetical protein FOMPIDRAFT_92001 [Fomitopsis schrenkii]|uniref:ABM domain-containing protein n=1 Tax=Fomitopsis schrenkii TaxID=2126942 RepID=S8F1V6_FOMSC|nr:hypothetical protein FOMPIDRAFT_92001 [Fomitopsis schrenkii]
MSTTFAHIKGELVITAQLVGKPGTGDELVKWADKLKEHATVNEPGTLEYTFGRAEDTLVVWERYANADALKQHMSSDIMKAFGATDLLADAPKPLFYGNIHADQNTV